MSITTDTMPSARTPAGGRKPRKQRRVFMWTFLAVQILFLIWVVTGIATVHAGPSHTDLASACYHHSWWPLFKSQADCVTHYGNALNDAGTIGKGIGLMLVIGLWLAADFILGIGRLIVLTARRRSAPSGR
jgi:hypothetical protein